MARTRKLRDDRLKEDADDEFDLRSELRIDPDALDEACLEQPMLYNKYAELLAQAKKNVDTQKMLLEMTVAEIDAEIRADPESFFDSSKKPTEGQIEKTIILQKRYRIAIREYNQAKYKAEMLGAAVRSLEQRKNALDNIIRLGIMGYYSMPGDPRPLSGTQIKKRHDEAVGAVRRKREMKALASNIEYDNDDDDK